METFLLVSIVVSSVGGFMLGRASKSLRVITLKDVLRVNTNRNDVRRAYDAALQMQNELAKCGAIKQKELSNGDIELTLNVVV